MPIKTLLAAFLMAAMPALAFAQCLGTKHTTTSASACSDTLVYDAVTGTCVPKPTS